MPLSCGCDDWGDFDWFYDRPADYQVIEKPAPSRIYPHVKRRACSSCGVLINYGALGLKFPRWRYPVSEIEIEIHKDEAAEIPLAPMYLCERCGDLWFSFYELGFECVSPDENMILLAREYGEINRARAEFN